jgi:hypothetical protein
LYGGVPGLALGALQQDFPLVALFVAHLQLNVPFPEPLVIAFQEIAEQSHEGRAQDHEEADKNLEFQRPHRAFHVCKCRQAGPTGFYPRRTRSSRLLSAGSPSEH